MVHGGDEWGDRPLSSHVLFRSADLDFARDMVAQKFCRHRLEVTGGGRFLAAQHHAPGRLLSLNYISYGADVTIDPGALETFYLLQIPIRGGATIRHHREEFVSNPGRAALLNADRATVMQWWAGCEQVLVQIRKSALIDFAERMLERRLPGELVFDPKVELGRADLRSFRLLLAAMFHAADATAGPNARDSLTSAFNEERVLEALLFAQPHSLSAFMDRQLAPAPRQVKRAHDFIRQNAARPIALSDIAAASGVGARSLQIGFRRAFGITPMQALCRERLRRARLDLEAGAPGETVTDVALRWGFTHLGRFSADYRTAFGELPRETLRRAG
jgi:AraC-type DNA-binding domain-containing proteins